jgi:3-phosphoglycerate kinase
MSIRHISDQDIIAQNVILRLDHNLPMDDKGNILDESRIDQSMETIKSVVSNARRTILFTHWGYPDGKPDERLSTRRLADLLAKRVPFPVRFCPSAQPEILRAHVRNLGNGELLYVENLRFLEEEESNSESLAKSWSELAEVYVNEAFSVCHRIHTSVALLPLYLNAFAGPRLFEERAAMRKVMEVDSPRAIVLGGAKSQQKLTTLRAMLEAFDIVVVGGISGQYVSASMGKLGINIDADTRRWLRPVVESLIESKAKLFYPLDYRILDNGIVKYIASSVAGNKTEIIDIGPETLSLFSEKLSGCNSIFWNGPMGVYEREQGREGTMKLARVIVRECERGAYCAAGGGDTLASLQMSSFQVALSHVSTGGGAALQYLADKDELPGIRPLMTR